MAVNGGAVLVGEPGPEKVHVLRRSAGQWKRSSLTVGVLWSFLGTSLAWDQETVVAGAPRHGIDTFSGVPLGAAIVYKPEEKIIPPSLARWAAVMRVLFGVIGGGGGLGVTPGGQPVPIDPEESLRRWQRLSPARQERTLARLIGEAGGLVRDPRSRRKLERIATTLLRKTRPDEAIMLRRRVRRSPPR